MCVCVNGILEFLVQFCFSSLFSQSEFQLATTLNELDIASSLGRCIPEGTSYHMIKETGKIKALLLVIHGAQQQCSDSIWGRTDFLKLCVLFPICLFVIHNTLSCLSLPCSSNDEG